MADRSGNKIRPLGRSLDPLTGESLGGYLLRLSHRLRLSPIKLARRIGCGSISLTSRLLFDLDIDAFATATRLSSDEAATLTLRPWADHYPPIARVLPKRVGTTGGWLFNPTPRYCPKCLSGDGSRIQELHGGPWKKAWHLPISFACPDHRVFLRHGCPHGHPPPRSSTLITSAGVSTLHPLQCRQPLQGGRLGPSSICGVRLDQTETTPAADTILTTQQRLLTALDSHHPAEDASQLFTDLRIITAVLSASWPRGRDLLEPAMAVHIDEHANQLRSRTYGIYSPPPENPVDAGVLLAAATVVRDSRDLPDALSQHYAVARSGRPSRSPLAQLVDRHTNSCSPALREAVEPLIRGYRRGGERGSKAPARSGGYRPEHIPAYLEDAWFERHLAQLNCDAGLTKVLRRTAAAILVQWSGGGALGDAASYLGINPKGNQFGPTTHLSQWLDGDQARPAFTAALKSLAAELDSAPDLIIYRHRRDALQKWSLNLGTWAEIVDRLQPVPGPVQPTLDDRKRQEASAFVWAHITQGEIRFAPRPITAAQPEPIRRNWAARRGATCYQLTRPDPVNHYADLRALLTRHARNIATEIDTRPFR